MTRMQENLAGHTRSTQSTLTLSHSHHSCRSVSPVNLPTCLSTSHSACVREPRDPAEERDPAVLGLDIFH